MNSLPYAQPLLKLSDVSVAFTHQGRQILAADQINLELAAGETLALVGESGSGKSVTALSILKLLPYPAASHPSGSILFEGQNLLQCDEKQLRQIRGRRIAMIFQEPMTSLNPLHTVERQIGEVLRLHQGLSGTQARMRIIELLTQVGIREPESRLQSYPHQLSGGQRQRVMIAMALANNPSLLIADEPTTALDVTVQAQILALLKSLQQQNHMAMLFITHDLGIVRQIADRVAVMTQGKIVEAGTTQDIFTRPSHDYTRKLLAAEPKGKPPAADNQAPIIMQSRGVSVHFATKGGFWQRKKTAIKAVDKIDICLRQGQTLGLVGESGSGKTTLGLALTRMIASQGEILFDGQIISNKNFRTMRPLRRHIQIVFQDPYGALSPRLCVADIVGEGLNVHEPGLTAQECEARVIAALEEVQIDPDTRHRYAHEFSGGQRQRIAIARAMILNPRFVMLDEPTSALDMSVQAQVVDLLRDLQRKHNLTYLFISHDLRVVRALAAEVMVLQHGKVVEHGRANDIFANPQQDYTKLLLQASFT